MKYHLIHRIACPLFFALLFGQSAWAEPMDSHHETLHDWHAGDSAKDCVVLPHCNIEQVLSYTLTGWQCHSLPRCRQEQALTRRSGHFQCVNVR